MEDVSMGMWVEQFNSTKPVVYLHSLKFCQFGCIEDYITAHYQSPRQMICMWDKLVMQGRPQCCNMRWWWRSRLIFRIRDRAGRETSFAVIASCIVYSVQVWVSYLWPCTNALTNSFIISCSMFPFPFWAWCWKMMKLDVQETMSYGSNFCNLN